MGFFVDRPRQLVASDFDTAGDVQPIEISEAFGPLLDEAFAREAEPDKQVRTNLVRESVATGALYLVNQRARTPRHTGKKSIAQGGGGDIYWWRVLVAMTFLGGVLLVAYSLEGSPTHAETRAVLFNIVQVGFPGLLALLGIETTKNG